MWASITIHHTLSAPVRVALARNPALHSRTPNLRTARSPLSPRHSHLRPAIPLAPSLHPDEQSFAHLFPADCELRVRGGCGFEQTNLSILPARRSRRYHDLFARAVWLRFLASGLICSGKLSSANRPFIDGQSSSFIDQLHCRPGRVFLAPGRSCTTFGPSVKRALFWTLHSAPTRTAGTGAPLLRTQPPKAGQAGHLADLRQGGNRGWKKSNHTRCRRTRRRGFVSLGQEQGSTRPSIKSRAFPQIFVLFCLACRLPRHGPPVALRLVCSACQRRASHVRRGHWPSKIVERRVGWERFTLRREFWRQRRRSRFELERTETETEACFKQCRTAFQRPSVTAWPARCPRSSSSLPRYCRCRASRSRDCTTPHWP